MRKSKFTEEQIAYVFHEVLFGDLDSNQGPTDYESAALTD